MSADIVGDPRRLEAERDALRAAVERVRALAERWDEEAATRGSEDQIYTAGVAGMILQALGDD